MEFADTDMAGIVHFANFFRFMETTEHSFCRSLGYRLHNQENGRMSGFARVHAECDYSRPLHYQDEVEIQLLVEKIGGRSLRYRFVFRRTESEQGPCSPAEIVARGALTVVCVARDDGDERMHTADLPVGLVARLEVAPPELLEREKPSEEND